MILATAIWGLGTVVVKSTVDDLTPSWIVGIRFLGAGILLGVLMAPKLVRRFDGGHAKAGVALGILLFLSYWTNTLGLTDTTASNSAFLTTFYVVIIPFLGWAITKRRPSRFTIIAAALCMSGLGFVAYGGSIRLQPAVRGRGHVGIGLLPELACAAHGASGERALRHRAHGHPVRGRGCHRHHARSLRGTDAGLRIVSL